MAKGCSEGVGWSYCSATRPKSDKRREETGRTAGRELEGVRESVCSARWAEGRSCGPCGEGGGENGRDPSRGPAWRGAERWRPRGCSFVGRRTSALADNGRTGGRAVVRRGSSRAERNRTEETEGKETTCWQTKRRDVARAALKQAPCRSNMQEGRRQLFCSTAIPPASEPCSRRARGACAAVFRRSVSSRRGPSWPLAPISVPLGWGRRRFSRLTGWRQGQTGGQGRSLLRPHLGQRLHAIRDACF